MFGRVLVLLLLIMVLAAGGIVWFDYLNVIDAKSVMAPVLTLVGLQGRSPQAPITEEYLNLDAERLAVRLETLELRKMELDTQQLDLDDKNGLIEQKVQELDVWEKSLIEREDSLKAQASDADNRDRNIEANARMLTGMPPERAVGIMAELDDQIVIDVLRKTEEIAQAEGTQSIVSYWLSLMDPARAAELQRKMAGRPQTL